LNYISDKYLSLIAFFGASCPGLENIDEFSFEGTSPPSSYLKTWLILILLNNIGLTNQTLNMHLVFNLFF
jgi:hypothetical protein